MREVALALATATFLAAAPAAAATRRIAVVVGNNAGLGSQPPLRYAEEDAGKMARVLVELGGVEPDDLALLQGRSLAEVQTALKQAHERVASAHQRVDERVVLLFYFSGHSDGESLEVRQDRLPFAELRRWLAGTGAEVKVAIIDSCKSGALLTAKGGSLGPNFQIHLTDDLGSTGQVFLTSSAANELALESSQIRGSYFTHQLVSGLRGAADASGDGRVTLEEAYQYAYAHTVTATASTDVGPQHPAYDYHLSGEGELVLTDLSRPTASLVLPAGFEHALVIQLARDQVLAELAAGSARRVALEPGEYGVKAWKDGALYHARIAVAADQERMLGWADLRKVPTAVAGSKGTAAPEVQASAPDSSGTPSLLVALGAGAGIADGLGPLASARIGLRPMGPAGLLASLDVETGRGDGFRETSASLMFGYRYGIDLSVLRAYAGLELGLGAVAQSLDGGSTRASAMASVAPAIGLAVHLTGPVSLVAEGDVPIALLKKDGAASATLMPAAWAGVVVAL